MRVLLGAFGDPGHAFPILALGRALHRRGHDVHVETWRRWEPEARALGLGFAAAPEHPVFPTAEHPRSPYEAVLRATGPTRALVRALAPDLVVHDVLTLAPALAAELEGVPWVTSIPHLDPRTPPDAPPFSAGARPPRHALGRALWRAASPLTRQGLVLGRRELDEVRVRLGLAPLAHLHGGISRDLCLVGTFPQLEPGPPRPRTHVVGPLQWAPPVAPTPLPDGDGPLVLVAPSTSQDPHGTLLQAALAAMGRLPVRVLAVGDPTRLAHVPANATLVPWVDYAATMPACDVVVCHGGHGTVARALGSGCVVVACPAAGDMFENAARVDWAGCGVRVPRRLVGPRAVRLAVLRALGEPALRLRARELAGWLAARDPAAHAARLLEDHARTAPSSARLYAGGEHDRG